MNRFRWSQFSPNKEAFHMVRAHLRGRHATKMHAQDFPEVFWIEEGQGTHTVNRQALPIGKGDLIFMRPTDIHALGSSSGTNGFVLVNIAFPASTLDFLRERYFSGENRLFWRSGPLPDMFRMDKERLAWLRKWVERLDSGGRSRLNIEIFLLELLRELHEDRPAKENDAGPDWLVETLRKISDPQVFLNGTPALARLAGRTPQHLNASLKKYRGTTATEAINTARMEFAAGELRTSTKKIIEVSLDCGFQNLAHFYRLFKAYSGLTPRAYRQSHQLLVR